MIVTEIKKVEDYTQRLSLEEIQEAKKNEDYIKELLKGFKPIKRGGYICQGIMI